MNESTQRGGGFRRAAVVSSRLRVQVVIGTGGLLVLMILLGGVAVAWAPALPRQSAESALTVNTIAARMEESVFEIRTYVGVVQATRSSDLGFESGGRLDSVLVQEGDVVASGQAIARLDTARLELKEQTLQDALERARQKLADLNPGEPAATSEAQRARIQELRRELDQISADLNFEDQAGAGQPPSGMDRLRILERQVAGLNEASRARQIDELEKLQTDLEGQIKDTRLQLDRCTLAAPFAGTIALRHVHEGAVVGQGMPIVRLVEQKAPLAWVGIPVDVAARIEPGQSAWLVVGDRTFAGSLKARLPQLDRTTRTRTVILEFQDAAAADAVIPGEVVNVDIWIENRQSGIWVPVSALNRKAEGLWSVFVVEGSPDHPVVGQRYVELVRMETDFALVRGTLDSGDLVIVDGIHRVVPGQTVVVRDVSETLIRPGPGGEPGQ